MQSNDVQKSTKGVWLTGVYLPKHDEPPLRKQGLREGQADGDRSATRQAREGKRTTLPVDCDTPFQVAGERGRCYVGEPPAATLGQEGTPWNAISTRSPNLR